MSIECSFNTFVTEVTGSSTEAFPEHTMLKGSFNRIGKKFSSEQILKPLLFKECFELPEMLCYFHKMSQLSGKRRGGQYFSLQYKTAEGDWRSSSSPDILRQDQLTNTYWSMRLHNRLSHSIAVLAIFAHRKNFLIYSLDIAAFSKPPEIWPAKIFSLWLKDADFCDLPSFRADETERIAQLIPFIQMLFALSLSLPPSMVFSSQDTAPHLESSVSNSILIFYLRQALSYFALILVDLALCLHFRPNMRSFAGLLKRIKKTRPLPPYPALLQA